MFPRVMRGRFALIVPLALFVSIMPLSASVASEEIFTQPDSAPFDDSINDISPGSPWLDRSLTDKHLSNQEKLRITAITSSLDHLDNWQRKVGAIDRQAPSGPGESLVRGDLKTDSIEHRTFWVNSTLLPKIFGVPGLIALIDAERSPEPYWELDSAPSPDSVRTGEIHGANDAWDLGYSGEGIIVAVADTGVDFAHPDLNGTQARVDFEESKYDGWPLMFDHNSMYSWVVDGEAYPDVNTWYADTSTVDFDNDSNGILDNSGYNISGINQSLSGVYHLGEHPDWRLRDKVGGDVPILVVDELVSGVYETVWPDIDRDGWFGNETPMRPGEETSGLDTDGDGLNDRWESEHTHEVTTPSGIVVLLDPLDGNWNCPILTAEKQAEIKMDIGQSVWDELGTQFGHSCDAILDLERPNPDSLRNYVEEAYDTNPLEEDSDNDLIPDRYEIAYGSIALETHCGMPVFGTLNIDAPYTDLMSGEGDLTWFEKDMDNDGRLNGPGDWDTDGDGMPDGFEYCYNSLLNPANSTDAYGDTDKDGLNNVEEFEVSYS